MQFSDALADVVAKTITGVGFVISDDGTGSCWAYSDNLIVTNAHVVSESSSITARINGKLLSVELIGSDMRSDIAVLKVNQRQQALAIADPPRLGSVCLALGSPRSFPESVSLGVVSGVNRSIVIESVVFESLIQTDCAINPGSSGGPIVNLAGDVIGMAVSGLNDAEGMNYAIGTEMLNFVIPRLVKNRAIHHAKLGVLLAEAIDDDGLRSVRVVRPEDRDSEFHVRDVITKIGTVSIRRRVDVWYALADLGKKKFIEVEVTRSRRKVKLRVPNQRDDDD